MLIITTRAETRTREIRRIDLFIFAKEFSSIRTVCLFEGCSFVILKMIFGSFYMRTDERIILLLPSLDERDFIGSRHENVPAEQFFRFMM